MNRISLWYRLLISALLCGQGKEIKTYKTIIFINHHRVKSSSFQGDKVHIGYIYHSAFIYLDRADESGERTRYSEMWT